MAMYPKELHDGVVSLIPKLLIRSLEDCYYYDSQTLSLPGW